MDPSRLDFRLEAVATGSRARAATFCTLHNLVQTPLFMPVGTQATVKAQLPQTLEASGSQILLANTYHLLLRPGPEVFERIGGIHQFMNWKRSVLTDSGGFQIFSLPHSRAMREEGAIFQSYLDGRTILLSPEVSIATQKSIGSDIMMALDQCIPSTTNEVDARSAMALTHRWATRSLAARGDSPQSLFGIVQGALFPELRRESAAVLSKMPFDGFAIGGLAVGEGRSSREDVCELTAELLPPDKPRYLMGVGTPLDILEAVHRGVDMFDCIMPTQLAQRGGVFTSRGFLQLRRSVYKYSSESLDPGCTCPTCAHHSRAYLHHLIKTGETLGWQLLGQHNLHFYHQLMRDIRASILEDRFLALYHEKRAFLHEPDADNPIRDSKPKRRRPRTMGAYEVYEQPPADGETEGFASIRHIDSGEIMHSRTPPEVEAQRLYVGQSRLADRLQPTESATALIVWDVGLGAAANAMGAIRCYEELAMKAPTSPLRPLGSLRPLHIVSFENDLDPLRLGRLHIDKFRYLRHSAPHALLDEGRWQSKQHAGLQWTLIQGDFMDTAPDVLDSPDVIFYDLFSRQSSPWHWNLEAFKSLYAVCQGRSVELYTYTFSTAARAAMLASGFYVAKGCATGEVQETTIACTPEALQCASGQRHSLLGSDWLTKWNRSQAKFPADLAPEESQAFEQVIRDHPQFRAVLESVHLRS